MLFDDKQKIGTDAVPCDRLNPQHLGDRQHLARRMSVYGLPLIASTLSDGRRLDCIRISGLQGGIR